MKTPATTNEPYKWAVPEELDLPRDPLRLRLDFYYQTIKMTNFEGDITETRIVSGLDVANALTQDMVINTGLLPANTLWWRSTAAGPYYALYIPPEIHLIAIQEELDKPALRLKIPLPGLIFLCSSGKVPWVYAVKSRPTKETDKVYKAPLTNVHQNGKTCGGSHKYPETVKDIPDSFFISFFTNTDNLVGRSKKHPNGILAMWKELDKKKAKKYPLDDLCIHGTIKDLLSMEMA